MPISYKYSTVYFLCWLGSNELSNVYHVHVHEYTSEIYACSREYVGVHVYLYTSARMYTPVEGNPCTCTLGACPWCAMALALQQ